MIRDASMLLSNLASAQAEMLRDRFEIEAKDILNNTRLTLWVHAYLHIC